MSIFDDHPWIFDYRRFEECDEPSEKASLSGLIQKLIVAPWRRVLCSARGRDPCIFW